MPTDFSYTPPAPEALSGPSFIDQTEQAINDLGGEIDNANNGAQEAISIANNALSTANAAQETAQDALSAANTAQSTADTALDAANSALDAANSAQSTADDALNAATTAQSTAELAQSAADNAQSAADNAQSAADNAIEVATESFALATTAMGVYTVEPTDALDGNSYYAEPAKLYVTGSSLVNFPQESGNFYFDVVVNSDATSATQRVWLQSGSTEWIRTASFDNTDPDNPVVVWTEWQERTGGGGGDVDISALKDGILSAITLNNADTDINLAVGTNGRYYIRNADIPNLPREERCIIEVVSDTAKSNTFMRADTLSGTQYTRYSQSNLSLGVGTAFYTFTASSGAASVTETIVFRADAQGNLSLRGQLGTGGNFSVDESVSSGVVIGCAIDFYSDNTVFRTDGFTLTIVDESGGGSDSISVDFPPLGAGYPTVTSDTSTTSNSYIRYQSGEQLNAGGSQATIYITATWTNYTGTITWTDWELVNASLASGTNFRGVFDASAGNYNAIENGNVGDWYVVSVGGVIGSITWRPGDYLFLAETITSPPTESQIDRVASPIDIAYPIPVAQGGTGVSNITGPLWGAGDTIRAGVPGTDYVIPSALNSYVPTSRTITTTAPLTGGGNLTANRTIGLGTVPIANGGTGATTAAAARNALGLGNTTGAVPIANGGTGATTAAAARNALGLGNTTGALPVANGGTGQTTVQAFRNSMGLGNTTGALPVANGGTGLTASPSMLTNLATTTAANVMQATPRPGVTGTLPITNGGTGATTAAAARTNLGIPTLPTNVAPLPQTAAGVGQIGTKYGSGRQTLPTGGTWAYIVVSYHGTTIEAFGAQFFYSGIAAGGTAVGTIAGNATHCTVVYWRIG